MDVDNLILFQRERDKRILKTQHLEGQSLLTKKILAFQVSIGELAAETNCYNFWSESKKTDKDLILTKYIKSLRSLVSIGIEKNFSELTTEDKELDLEITEQFLNLFIDTNDLIVCSSKDNYITLLEDFLCLGRSLGLDDNIIKSNYIGQYSN
ncbi:MAG: dUTP diphosphatase [Bacillota bacterium]|nr:dUTP diphosphatase [Bacillota bacterium]